MQLVRVTLLISADLALAGIESRIPVDEVIEAMDKCWSQLPASLRELDWVTSRHTNSKQLNVKSLAQLKIWLKMANNI